MRVVIFLALLCCSTALFAHGGSGLCSKGKTPGKAQAKTTIATPEEDYYDVQYLKFNISLTNTSTAISGDVTTRAKVLIASLNLYAFELDPALTIDSFKFNNQLQAVTTNGSVRTVTVSPALSQGDVFTAQVFYHGQPPSGTGFFTKGLNYAKLASGTEIMYTLSDPNTAEDWWPSKQSIRDKIDSVDMWVTVPQGTRAGSNGLLQAVTPMPANKFRYEWKTRYPIDYYLISVAVAPYSDYSYYMHFTDGSNDSMLIQNYVYDSAAYMAVHKPALDSTGLMVDYFSKLFGRYPFDKEKYGHCVAQALGGGMEHQTMTTLGASGSTILISHELGHQWWGDHVTYGTWADIWLSEGFASYCEQLFVEHFRGIPAFKNYRTTIFNNVMSATGGSVYVDDTNDVNRVFHGRLTYHKGAAVSHMLRYVAPEDSLFFVALRQYQQQFAFSNAITPDLQAIMEQVYSKDLDTFFQQWIYKEGYPTYSAKWYQSGNDVYLQINQVTSKPSSVAVFSLPLEIKLKSAAGDTVVKVYNNQSSQNYYFTWGDTMNGLEIDPENHVVNKTGSIIIDPKLALTDVLTNRVRIYPNPATEGWKIEYLPEGTELLLTDAKGRRVWQATATQETYIPAKHLAAGVYNLTVRKGDMSKNFKLVK